MNSLTLSIALRYLKSKRSGFLSLISKMGFIGIAMGVAVLIIVTSVMNGFERELRERVLEVIPHATIEGPFDAKTTKQIRNILSSKNKVEGTASYIETQALVSSNESLKGIILKGVSSMQEIEVSQIEKHMILGDWFSLDKDEFNIVIGNSLALQLGVGLGDKISLMVPDTAVGMAGSLPKTKRFIISGIFNVGASDVDSSYAYINLDNASKLLRLGELIHGIRIKYSNLFEANQLILEDRADISKILNRHLKASSWSTNYGTLFRAVTMERYLVSFLLFFIILVAVFNIVSALAMTVREKQSQIAILMTLGLSNRRIKNIFLYFGSLIGLIGGLLGLFIGLVVTYNLDIIFSFIENALGIMLLEWYFINYFPIDVRLNWVLSIVLISIFLTVLASLYPAKMATKITPHEALRHE